MILKIIMKITKLVSLLQSYYFHTLIFTMETNTNVENNPRLNVFLTNIYLLILVYTTNTDNPLSNSFLNTYSFTNFRI